MPVTFRHIGVFFLITYALTWFGIAGNFVWPSVYWPTMNPLGPVMAAPLAILVTEGRGALGAWFSRLGNIRAPLWVYAVAFAGPLAIIIGSVGLAAVAGAPTQDLPQYAWYEFLIGVPIAMFMGPAPEELAFRGHGQHELQKAMSPLMASLWIGSGVAIWHLPLILSGQITLPWIVSILAVSVVYAWIYNVGGSVWPVVTVHFTVNYFGGEFLGQIVATPDGQYLYASIFAGFYVLWALTIVAITGASLGLRQPGRLELSAA